MNPNEVDGEQTTPEKRTVWVRVRGPEPREVPPEVEVGRDHEIMEYYRKVEATLTEREVLTVRVDVLTELWNQAWRHGIDTRNQEIAPLEEDRDRLSRMLKGAQEEIADLRDLLEASRSTNRQLRADMEKKRRSKGKPKPVAPMLRPKYEDDDL